MDGRKISAVYWPDSPSEQGVRLRASDEKGLTLEWSTCEVAGCWIVKKIDGKEVARINPRYVDFFEWETPY